MNTLNLTAAKSTRCHAPLIPSLNPYRPSFSRPVSSFSVIFPPPPLHGLSVTSVKASLRHENPDKPLKLIKFQIDTSAVSVVPFQGPLRAALVTTITAAALLLSGFGFSLKPSIAAPIPPPPTVETSEKESISEEEEEREKSIEEELLSNPNDVELLKNLMEIKINKKNVPEAMEIVDKLMVMEPEDMELPLMKAHMHSYNGEKELAKDIFNELSKKDPFLVEAYHGLVTVLSQDEKNEELRNLEDRVIEIMKLCVKQKKKDQFVDFKLLLAQIKVLEKRYDEALMVYQELTKDEPRDFRPYLCQGIVYTMLRKKSEAEKNFEKYRRLVPKGHPSASYFDENMRATKLFAERMESERAMSKS